MRHLLAAALLAAGPAAAQELTVLHAWPHHAEWQTAIAEGFMAENPGVEISFQAPSPDYDEGLVSVIRQDLAGEAPDVFMVGSHLLRNLVARGMVEPLEPLMEGRDMAALGYAPEVLALTQVDGVQYALPWTSSTPVMFYNAELVERAGGDPDAMPETWDGVIELAAAIDALGPDVSGMYYTLGDDDWMTQNLLANAGLSPMGEDGATIAFDTEAGREVLATYRRFFDEGGQQPIEDTAARQQMYAGQLGLYFNSTAAVRSFSREIGDRFDWGTAPMPAMQEGGGVASGGMAAVILADDPAKREAAFEYLLHGTGAEAQAMVVRNTGYMPVNQGSLEVLDGFYEENPSFRTSATQADRAFPWFAWPGRNGVRISRVVLDEMTTLANGGATPEETAARLTSEIEPLLN